MQPKNKPGRMLKNHLLLAIRQLRKNRLYSFVNIAGLSLGMAVALSIGLWVHDELAFNTSIPNHKRIAEVMREVDYNGVPSAFSGGPLEMEAELKTKYSGDFKHIVLGTYPDNHLLTVNGKNSNGKSISVMGQFMGEEVTQMLSLKVKGNPNGLLDQSSIFLSASTAKALFGNDDPINKTLTLDSNLLLKVAGVYPDLPANSSFANLQFIAPAHLFAALHLPHLAPGNPWRVLNLFSVYVQLADNADIDKINEKIKYLRRDKMPLATFNADRTYQFLYPMSRWHLYEALHLPDSRDKIQYVWLLSFIGVFVLLLACINFINLSTARTERRAKEVGIRKTIGSRRGQLIVQFFSESLLAVAFAAALCLVWTQGMLPVFNNLTDKNLAIPYTSLTFWAVIAGTTFLTSVLAGGYPALYLSSFRPIETLKTAFRVGPQAATPRKILVVVQFTISIALIIGTMIVYRQIQYAQQRPIGYNKNGLITITRTAGLEQHFESFRQELKRSGVITDAALVTSTPTEIMGDDLRFTWSGKDPNQTPYIPISTTTPGYGKIIGWQLKEGRDFDPSLATDSAAFVLNEAAVRLMGFQHPLGQTITWRDKPYHVIGVVRDLLDQSPYQSPGPEIFHISGNQRSWAVVLRVDPKAVMADALPRIKAVYARYEPRYPIEYKFVDQEYAKKFGDEVRIGRLSGLFTLFAVIISCLGLFGMASYMAEQRRKEIGIRKVLGASTFTLWRLLTREFLTLVTIALGIAGPLSALGMHKWLQQYPYRTTLSWPIFAAAALGALALTFATVSYQTIKAALTNPTQSLRSE
jgi:hypothetical protein